MDTVDTTDTVIELLLPYLELKEVCSILKINMYWKNRINSLFPKNYVASLSFCNNDEMYSNVYDIRLPLPSMCNDKWKILIQISNENFNYLKHCCFSIVDKSCPRGLGCLFQVYKNARNKIKLLHNAETKYSFKFEWGEEVIQIFFRSR